MRDLQEVSFHVEQQLVAYFVVLLARAQQRRHQTWGRVGRGWSPRRACDGGAFSALVNDDVFIPSIVELWARLAPRLVHARTWLGDVLRPTGDVEVFSRDGAVVTGILLVDQGVVVAALVVRARGPRRRDMRWSDDPMAWGPYS